MTMRKSISGAFRPGTMMLLICSILLTAGCRSTKDSSNPSAAAIDSSLQSSEVESGSVVEESPAAEEPETQQETSAPEETVDPLIQQYLESMADAEDSEYIAEPDYEPEPLNDGPVIFETNDVPTEIIRYLDETTDYLYKGILTDMKYWHPADCSANKDIYPKAAGLWHFQVSVQYNKKYVDKNGYTHKPGEYVYAYIYAYFTDDNCLAVHYLRVDSDRYIDDGYMDTKTLEAIPADVLNYANNHFEGYPGGGETPPDNN